MDQLRIGYTRLRQRIRGAEILDDALVDHDRSILALTRHGVAMRRAGLIVTNLIERRHVVAGNGCKLLNNLRARDSFVTQAAMQLAGLEPRFLALADEAGIEDGRVRLRVVHRGTAGDDDGVVFASVGRQQRNASEVESLEEVRHRHLVRHMQADDIKRSDRRCTLEREQRNARLAHSVTHIGPRHIATLAGDALGLVKDVVEDGDALVGQTDLVHIRIDQAATVVGIGL